MAELEIGQELADVVVETCATKAKEVAAQQAKDKEAKELKAREEAELAQRLLASGDSAPVSEESKSRVDDILGG